LILELVSFKIGAEMLFLAFFDLEDCALSNKGAKTIVNNSKNAIFTIQGLNFTLNLYPRFITGAKIN